MAEEATEQLIERRRGQFTERMRKVKGRIAFVCSAGAERFVPTEKGIQTIRYAKPIKRCDEQTVKDVANFFYAVDPAHVVVIGGGKVIDTVRLAASAVKTRPYVLPTTGSGVVFHPASLVWTADGPRLQVGEVPKQIFLDAMYIYGTPKTTITLTGLTALATSIDAIHGIVKDEMEMGYAISAAGSLSKTLGLAYSGEHTAMSDVLMNSSPAGNAIRGCGIQSIHRTAIAIVTAASLMEDGPAVPYGVAAGLAVKGALSFPYIKKLNDEVCEDIFGMNLVDTRAWISGVLGKCGYSSSLEDLGIGKRVLTSAIKSLDIQDDNVRRILDATW